MRVETVCSVQSRLEARVGKGDPGNDSLEQDERFLDGPYSDRVGAAREDFDLAPDSHGSGD